MACWRASWRPTRAEGAAHASADAAVACCVRPTRAERVSASAAPYPSLRLGGASTSAESASRASRAAYGRPGAAPGGGGGGAQGAPAPAAPARREDRLSPSAS